MDNSAFRAISAFAAAAVLAGCNVGGSQASFPSLHTAARAGAMGNSEAQVRAIFMKTNPMRFAPMLHHAHFHNHLSMLPLRAAKTKLIYVSDITEGAVEAFDYPSGTYLGEATGFLYPYGECSDKQGNVYVADFDAQTISEIAEGTTTVIKVVDTPKGYPGGCAVNPKTGDLAVTLFAGGNRGVGSVVIYTGGISGSPTAYHATDFTWPAAYDSNGNLYAEGEEGRACLPPGPTCIWTLQAGSFTPKAVTWHGGSFEYPAAIELSDTTLMFGQQQYNKEFETAIYPTTCSGTTCNSTTPIVLTDTCDNTYADIVQWAEDSTKPNLQSKGNVAGTHAIAGGNLYCSAQKPYYVYVNTWGIGGGNPTASFGPPPYSAYGQTIVN